MDQVQAELQHFKKDAAYYKAHREDLFEDLLRKYSEQWVAIFDQQVTGASPDYEKLFHDPLVRGHSLGKVFVQHLTMQDELLILCCTFSQTDVSPRKS